MYLGAVLDSGQQRREGVGVAENLGHVLAHAAQLLLQDLVWRFFRRVLADDLLGIVLDVDARVAHAHDDAVEAQEEAAEQEQSVGHDADFDAEQADAVVCQLVFVQVYGVEEEDGVWAAEQVCPDGMLGLVCCLPFSLALAGMCGAFVIGAIAPVERLDDLLHALRIAILLPRICNCDLKHTLLRLADTVESVSCIEV